MVRSAYGKRLLIIAGPSASGKSTFIAQFEKGRRTDFAKKALRELAIPGRLSLQRLKLKPASNKVRSGKSCLKSRGHYVMHLDLTSKKRNRHLKACPAIFGQFKSVHVIQIYLPYEDWLRRIRTRIDAGAPVSGRAKKLYEYGLSDFRKGEFLYRRVYVRWENYLDLKRIRDRVTVDTCREVIFANQPESIRRRVVTRAIYSAVCRRPSMMSFLKRFRG